MLCVLRRRTRFGAPSFGASCESCSFEHARVHDNLHVRGINKALMIGILEYTILKNKKFPRNVAFFPPVGPLQPRRYLRALGCSISSGNIAGLRVGIRFGYFLVQITIDTNIGTCGGVFPNYVSFIHCQFSNMNALLEGHWSPGTSTVCVAVENNAWLLPGQV